MVYKAGKIIISGLGTALLLSLVFMNFFYRSFINMTQEERVDFSKVGPSFIIPVAILIILFILFLRMRLVRYISPQVVAAASALLYLGIGMYLIFHVEPVVRSDVKLCYESALGFTEGDYSSLEKGGYLYENAHQIGFVLYDMLLLSVSRDVRFLFYMNLLLTIINNILMLRLTSICTDGSRDAVTIASLLSLLFLPHLAFILFGYNQTVSITLMLVSSISLASFLRKHGLPSFLIMVASSFLALCVRGNAAICVLAEIIIIVLHTFRRRAEAGKTAEKEIVDPDADGSEPDIRAPRRNALCIAAVVSLLIAMLLAGPAMRMAGERVTGQKLPKALPMTMWIAMGMQDGPRASGWYNGYIYRSYRENNYDLPVTSAKANKEIAERMQVFFGNPGLLLFFYSEKILSTWTEPTYESIWSGPLEDMNQHTRGAFMNDLYTGGSSYSVFCNYCAVINILIYVGAFIGTFVHLTGLIKCRSRRTQKKDRRGKVLSSAGLDTLLFPGLLLLGGFFFHILWETKSQYVLFYVYMLIPLASFGYAFVCPRAFTPRPRNQQPQASS